MPPQQRDNEGPGYHRLFGPKLQGRWIAFGCRNKKCGAVWMVRSKDMKRRLKIQSNVDGTILSTMPCPVCFHTGRIE